MSEERRLVTVLFADVTGSTALGESLDPEDLRALLGRYYAIAREVVEGHGGTLEKFIGDAVMAVFGLPVAHGDDAARALSAALELRDRVRDDPRLGERLPIRVGVNTGEVVASRDAAADRDFLVTGDAVNVAARLQQSAASWGIAVGERTARAAPAFRYGPVDAVEAKGKSGPIRAVELLGHEERPVTPARMPLFGRDGDLQQLDLVARRAFGERRPFLVSLIAPAGTGKTRLLEECLARLPSADGGPLVATAQCLPYGQRLTFWPLRSMLHRLVGVAEEIEADGFRLATTEWLHGLAVDEPERVAAQLTATVGAGEVEVADRGAMFAAWRSALEAAAARRPLVLVFEDLHWSSDSLLDLVDYVMQPRADVPLLMLVLTRPELLDRRPGWGAGRRNHLSLALEPLDDAAVAEMVRHLLESASPEIVSAVVERSEGNPFYAGEIVRSIVDRVGPRASNEEVVAALATLPDTVQATVLARLDAVDAAERRVLQLGAVFGRTFRTAGIAALEPSIADRADALADSLAKREMIRSSGGDGFAFRHILIREVAYSTLPRAERARLHAAAGAWLEARAVGREEEYAELIAEHFREAAGLAATLELSEAADISAVAVRWLRQAAETAMRAAANIEAARHLRSALELAAPDVHPEILEAIGDTYAGGDATVAAYEEAYRRATAAGRTVNDRLRVLAKLLEYEMRFQASVGGRRTPEAMRALLDEGRALLSEATDERARGHFHVAQAFLPWWISTGTGGRVEEEATAEAERSGLRALEIAERIGDANLASAARDALGGAAQDRGDWKAAYRYAAERLELGERLDLKERLDARGVLVWSAVNMGRLDEADRVSAETLAMVQPGQMPNWTLHIAAWRTYGLYLQGRWDEALEAAERGHRLWIDTGRTAAGYSVHGFRSALLIARARGHPAESERWREVIDEILARFAPDSHVVRFVRAIIADDPAAMVPLLEQDVPATGVERFERAYAFCADHGAYLPSPGAVGRALERARHDGTPIFEGQVHRVAALVHADPAEADLARALFDACGALPSAARARCEAALLRRSADELAAGMAILERLGDAEQIARYERRSRER
ncbi:MAG TPA: adenylate/guanylate cyclase domain-containing protein [Candidatus Limnocylindrales bacterium]|nr:adenylate/guanylate cyclase domain-containing protein [Candidatus Limnocylindrales bacterium]